MGSGKLYSTNTVMQRQMNLPNNSDFPQHTGFEYTVVQGTTSSTTHKLDFGIDLGVGLDIKILFITAGLSAHFKVGAGAEWTTSMSTGEIEKYEYDLYVPAHSQYHAEAVVEEGLVSMDYEIVFTVSGKYHSLKGTWEGTLWIVQPTLCVTPLIETAVNLSVCFVINKSKTNRIKK